VLLLQVMGIELFRGDLRGRCFFADGDMAPAGDEVCSLNAGARAERFPV
jgi:hypothetical protein